METLNSGDDGAYWDQLRERSFQWGDSIIKGIAGAYSDNGDLVTYWVHEAYVRSLHVSCLLQLP